MKQQELIKKVQDLKEDLEALKTQRAREEGRYEEALANLAKLGYSSLEEAHKRLNELEGELAVEVERLEEQYNTIREKYADFIE